MSIQLRSVQMVNWSHLPPTPIGLSPGVNAFLGANGSGKSSALDAIKAVLGAARFGQNRSAASYIHRSPAGEAAEALVLLVVSGANAVCGSDLATLCLSVTRRNRRFLLLNEPLYLGLAGADVARDLQDLFARHPRGSWLSAERWLREVVGPLGVSPTVIRLLELPQGEAGRIISSRQQDLLPQLLSMLGFDDRVGVLREERARLQEARERQDQARREVLAERRRAAALEEAERAWQEWQARAGELAHARAGLRGALAHALGHAEPGAEENGSRERLRVLDEELGAMPEISGRDRALAGACALAERVPGARVVARHLAPADPRAEAMISGVLGTRLIAIVCGSQSAFDRLVSAAAILDDPVPIAHVRRRDLPPPAGLRAQARASDPLVDAYLHALGCDALEDHGEGVTWDRSDHVEWMPPGAPFPNANDPHRRTDLEQERTELLAELRIAERDRATAVAQRAALEAERAAVGDGEAREEEDLPRWRAEADAAERALGRLPDADALAAQVRALAVARRRIADAEQILGEHDALVERLLGALDQAEDIWREEVAGLIAVLGARFAALAEAAGMEGEISADRDGSGEWRIDLMVSEHPGRPRKSYFRDGDLSGGWKAKVGLILMLAALTGGEGGFPIVLLDEHAAALDEDRIAEVGGVMRQLAARDGLQFCLGLPTRRAHERISWAAQQIGFLAPEAGAAHAPPPLLIAAATR